VPSVVPAHGAALLRILDTTDPAWREGLSRPAFATLDTALTKIPWSIAHQRRFALMDRSNVLASAQQYDLAGVLDERAVSICGIGSVFTDPAHGDRDHARLLVDRLLFDAKRNGADVALLSGMPDAAPFLSIGFEVMPTLDLELTVAESPRRGAPMTLVRGGEDRDLAAIAAMGDVRAAAFRFHLDRDADHVKHAITVKRLLAGLSPAGVRELCFVIAEEGITAAAYVVMSTMADTWTIEECGDRDPSGARVGAILQALIAREPSRARPTIRGWLPPGFAPPQVTIASAQPPTKVMLARLLTPPLAPLKLTSDDVLFWRGDDF
jgi:hypothetical protein